MSNVLFIMSGAVATSLMPQWMLIFRQELAEVRFQTVLTSSATSMVSTSALEATSGGAVYEETQNNGRCHYSPTLHMELAEWADVIAVVPATYNSIIKMSLGLADNLALTIIAYADCPIIVSPAVGVVPAASRIYREAKSKILQQGITFIPATVPTMETHSGQMVYPQGGDGAPDCQAVLAALKKIVDAS